MKGKDTSLNFVIISQRKKQLLMCHKKVIHEGVRYSCKKWSKFTTVIVLKRHMQSKHEGKEFSYISRSNKSLKIHKHTKHGSAVYKCKICDYVTGWKYYLRTCTNNTHANKTYSCEKCGKTFRQNYYLKQHIALTHTAKAEFQCDKCDYKAKL